MSKESTTPTDTKGDKVEQKRSEGASEKSAESGVIGGKDKLENQNAYKSQTKFSNKEGPSEQAVKAIKQSVLDHETQKKIEEIKANKFEIVGSPQHVKEYKPDFKQQEKTDAKHERKTEASKEGLTPKQKALEKKYGVHITIDHGLATYHLLAGSKDEVLMMRPANDLKGADKALHNELVRRQSVLSREYNVSFSKDGEDGGSEKNFHGEDSKVHAKCRAPRFDELVGVKAALDHSWPAYYSKDGIGAKFMFMQNGNHHYANFPSGAIYESPSAKGQPPMVFIDPTESRVAATIAESTNGRSMQQDIIHELSHGTEARNGWREISPGTKPPQTLEEVAASRMGWTKHNGEYYLKGKHGEYYKCDVTNPDNWTVYDSNFQTGKPPAHKNAAQVRAEALFTPVSNYFKNPEEMMAECLAHLRMGGQSLEEFKSSPLYAVTNWLDQMDIDLGAGGPNRMHRADNGLAVPENPQARK